MCSRLDECAFGLVACSGCFKFFQAHPRPVFSPRWGLLRIQYACTHWVSLASWHGGTSFRPRTVGRSVASAVQPVLPSRGSASWADVAVTLVAGIVGPSAEVAGLVALPLPLGEMARVVAQLGCDRGLHQHVPLRVQSVPVIGGVNVLVNTAM